jgi:predicted ATP-grasp superfamily ATP-dependent carboligase
MLEPDRQRPVTARFRLGRPASVMRAGPNDDRGGTAVVTPHRIPVVLTALNLNGLGVARVLGEHGVEVHAVHEGEADAPETRTRRVRSVWPRRKGEDLVGLLLDRARQFGGERPVLLPITDESVAAVAEHHAELAAAYRIPFGDPAAVLRLLSKKGIDEAARALRMPVPPTYVVEDPAGIEAVARQVRYPCILKPQDKSPEFASTGAQKAQRPADAAELVAAYRSFCAAEPRAVVQEFIPGGDAEVCFCLVALAQDGALLGAFVGHKIRQWPPHCGGTASCEPLDAPELVELTARFLRDSGLRGIGSCEYKRDPRDGRFYLIEPTVGRTDWQNAVADIHGVPIPYLVYCDLTGAPVPAVRPFRLARRWLHFTSDRRSAEHYRRRGELGRLAWLWSLRPPLRWAYFSWTDLGPAWAIWRATLGRLAAKVGRLFGLGRGTRTKERSA